MSRLSRTPVDWRDCVRRSGKEIVLLKVMAGVAQDGSLKTLTRRRPRLIESAL